MPDPNAHGVYEAGEVLRLPFDQKGWRGVDTAEIELLDLRRCWLWSASYSLMRGEMTGRFEPLKDRDGRRSPTRDAAIDAASAYLRERMSGRSESRDARRILDWLDTLQPAQPDLFGAAA